MSKIKWIVTFISVVITILIFLIPLFLALAGKEASEITQGICLGLSISGVFVDVAVYSALNDVVIDAHKYNFETNMKKLKQNGRLYFMIYKHRWLYDFIDYDYLNIVDLPKTLRETNKDCWMAEDNIAHALEQRIIKELGPALAELYEKARYNADTLTAYEDIMPQIEELYDQLDDINDNLQDENLKADDKHNIIQNTLDNLDVIIQYIKNLQKPIEKIITSEQDVIEAMGELSSKSNSHSEQIDYFSELREYNRLSEPNLKDLMNKYDDVSISPSLKKKKKHGKKKKKAC